MRSLYRLAFATVATAALVATGTASASATTVTGDTVSPHIIGGSSGSSPYIVQLVFGQSDGTYGCTGEAIAPQWILTAQHCIDGTQWMDVYFSNSVTSPGTPIAADQVGGSSYGDVALVHLSSSKSLSSYAPLASSYSARSGDSGTIWGYGLTAGGAQPTHLNKATVNVVGSSTDAYGGSAIHVKGSNGASNHGDSGGPLFVGGVIVGVCSTGDVADPGSDIHAGSNYANLTASRSWIRSVTGV
ncbi:S1 family peptidase [Flexivirga oryzae]|uniref:Secreted trypsin-like serine protease n=1 Tax=Flexivirga oryzae TaxID=1794944 RepID=A0A839N902_9MICO|nr:trypsin-like serine protease [Flexivirga oryzae]MBB2894258.1 secreted trypsin-like serine protease [Flexivirga oryzae]